MGVVDALKTGAQIVAGPTGIVVGGVLDATGVIDGSVAGKADDLLRRDDPVKLSQVLTNAGWGSPNSSRNRQARSVVIRESGGDENATNPSGATGLFQIMTPLHCGSYGIPKADCVQWLKDPENNAKAAYKLFLSNGWRPWVTSGPIPPPLTDKDPTVYRSKDSVTGKASELATGGIVNPFSAVASAVVDLVGILLSPDTWFRIGKTALGSVFIIVGIGALVFIVANQASGGAVKRTAVKTAKVAVTKKVVT